MKQLSVICTQNLKNALIQSVALILMTILVGLHGQVVVKNVAMVRKLGVENVQRLK
jgi:hypothetical protein